MPKTKTIFTNKKKSGTEELLPKAGTSKSQNKLNTNSLKEVTEKSPEEPYDIDKLFPKIAPSKAHKKMTKKKARKPDAVEEDIEKLTKLFQKMPSEKYSEDSCSSEQEPIEDYDVVVYIKGFHFVVHSKNDPSELELVTAEKYYNHYMCLYLEPRKDVPKECPEFKFTEMATELRKLRLPDPSWKIIITLQGRKIKMITFTNSSEVAKKSVSFSANDDCYEIIINNRPAELMGSPGKVQNREELETLLRIVEVVAHDNSMIEYKTDS